MKCPHCGKEFKLHRKMPKLNERQKKTLKFCKHQPRYGFEIAKHLFGPSGPYTRSATTISVIGSLVGRNLLFHCHPNTPCLLTMKDKRAKTRKYYTSNPEYDKRK